MIGRIVRSVDFERVLAAPARARSSHFALHHMPGVPTPPAKPSTHKLSTELSTEDRTQETAAVDDTERRVAAGPRVWLGTVVPKRHARRSVTRSLLKRQIRAAACEQAGLPEGLWVVRLKAPFPVQDFPSAASDALRRLAREELSLLLSDAVRRSGRT